VFIASPILVEFAHYKRRREKARLDRRTSGSLRKSGAK
jgi:hypothetical protein